MKLFITGACGFVGSTLIEAMLEHSQSLEITGIDNFSRNGSWLNREFPNASDLEALGPFDWLIDAAASHSVLAGVDGKNTLTILNEIADFSENAPGWIKASA